MEKINNHYLLENIFSYVSEIKVLKLIKYNNKLKQLLKINIYNYQKLFIQNHFMVDLSKFKISNLIKFFKSNYNNFSEKEDENALKKIISEISWCNDYKKEKIISKNDSNYKKCLNIIVLQSLMESNNSQLLSNLKILNIQLMNNEISIKDIFPNLVKLKIKGGDISISNCLLKRIQILSLINTRIKVEPTYIETELLLLKSLKIVGFVSIEFIENVKKCPNLENLFLVGIENVHNFFHYRIPNLYEILLMFSKLNYCNILYVNKYEVGSGLAEDHYSEITIKRCEKNLFKYETQKYVSERKGLDNYYFGDFNREEKKDLYIKKFYYS